MKTHKTRRSMPALDWLCDLSGKTARITSLGNRSLLVENHRGILAFASDCIVLATACGNAQVVGAGLSLREVRRDTLIIQGSIHDVKLPHGEADDHEP